MTAAARITEPSPAVEKRRHKLSELATYKLRDYRHALERAIASGRSHDPGAPARTVLQGRLDAVIAEQDDRARIARTGTGPDIDEVRDNPNPPRLILAATGPEPRTIDSLGHTGQVDVLATLDVGESAIVLRRAKAGDLPAIVDLLAADQLGVIRDGIRNDADLRAYRRAFVAIDRDPAHVLIVAAAGDRVVATMQVSFLPGLARRGALRAQIEAVRVHEDFRSGGLGHAMLTWAIDGARQRGCALVQLTTDKSRTGAHRFYERLGFVASHEGMKLILDRA